MQVVSIQSSKGSFQLDIDIISQPPESIYLSLASGRYWEGFTWKSEDE